MSATEPIFINEPSSTSSIIADQGSSLTSNIQNQDEHNEPEGPEIDIIISNVVSTFNTKCHLNLKNIALNGMNVIYRRETGMVSMKMRKPSALASIWSSGKVSCTGSTSIDEAKVVSRKVARCLWHLGFNVRFCNFKIVNILGTCKFPFRINVTRFTAENSDKAVYDPELHPGVTYRMKEPKATLKIYSTGSITITASSVETIQHAIEHIYPLAYEHKWNKPEDDVTHLNVKLPVKNMSPRSAFTPKRMMQFEKDYIRKKKKLLKLEDSEEFW